MFTSSFPFLFLLYVFVPYTNAQACAAGSAQQIQGNWYCSEVKAITYKNFPGHGFYNRVTNMDASTGQCTTETHQYSGSLSPLNEELSFHIRGPTWLKKFAVYDLPSSSQKRDINISPDLHVHPAGSQGRLSPHQALHAHHRRSRKQREDAKKRAVNDLVVATINGKVVSWKNEYAGPTATPDAVSSQSAVDAPVVSTKGAYAPPATATKSPSTASTSDSDTNKSGVPQISDSDWTRTAYYDADNGHAEGLTFLNHFGGPKSGTAAGGSAFGASLSYASSDATSGATSSQILKNAMIDDGDEIIIMSDRKCQGSDCGYTRPGGISYHGFGGSYKIFLIEFSMPLTGKTDFNGDMPGIWLLNAQVPLTSQYGMNPKCSCWTSGCGEFDLFEVLDHGNHRCKSCVHMVPAGGSSDWFMRPTEEPITAAVVFAGKDQGILLKVLDGEQDFDGSFSKDLVDGWMEGKSSLFKMQT